MVMSRAYIFFSCETGFDDSVISRLRLIESVTEVYGTLGKYDVIAKLESDSEDVLQETIARKIRKLDKIKGTLTLIVNKDQQFSNSIKYELLKNVKNISQAYIIIDCNHANEYQVFKNLKEIPEVIECDVLIGSYELICRIVAPTYNDISDVVTNKIRKLEKIRGTMTLYVIG